MRKCLLAASYVLMICFYSVKLECEICSKKIKSSGLEIMLDLCLHFGEFLPGNIYKV